MVNNSLVKRRERVGMWQRRSVERVTGTCAVVNGDCWIWEGKQAVAIAAWKIGCGSADLVAETAAFWKHCG